MVRLHQIDLLIDFKRSKTNYQRTPKDGCSLIDEILEKVVEKDDKAIPQKEPNHGV